MKCKQNTGVHIASKNCKIWRSISWTVEINWKDYISVNFVYSIISVEIYCMLIRSLTLFASIEKDRLKTKLFTIIESIHRLANYHLNRIHHLLILYQSIWFQVKKTNYIAKIYAFWENSSLIKRLYFLKWNYSNSLLLQKIIHSMELKMLWAFSVGNII